MSEEITEPEVTPEPAQPNDDLQAIMTKLDEFGISKPEQLDNKMRAASESGRLANIVGELREEVAELKSAPPAPQPSEYDNDGVDIDAAIGNAVTKALDEREAKARKVHLARASEARTIRSNENYKIVGPKFERYMNSPEANSRMGNGETPTSIFNKMVIGEYRDMMVQMKTAVESSTGNPGQTAVPHMETDQTAPPRTTPADEKKVKLKNIRENWSGNDEDLTKALDALLPSGSLPLPKDAY